MVPDNFLGLSLWVCPALSTPAGPQLALAVLLPLSLVANPNLGTFPTCHALTRAEVADPPDASFSPSGRPVPALCPHLLFFVSESPASTTRPSSCPPHGHTSCVGFFFALAASLGGLKTGSTWWPFP